MRYAVHTPVAATLPAELALVEDGVNLRRGADVNPQLRTLANAIKALATAGANSPPRVLYSLLSLGTEYQLVLRDGTRLLELTPYTDFSRTVRAMVPATTPEFGWTKVNTGKLASGDQDITTSDALTLAVTSASTNLNTCYYQYKLYYPSRGTMRLTARVASNGDQNNEICGICLRADHDPVNTVAAIGVGAASGIVRVRYQWGQSSGTANITSGQRDAGVWLDLQVDPIGHILISYSVVNQETRPDPTDWNQVIYAQLFQGFAQFRGGIYIMADNTNGDLVGTVKHFDDLEARTLGRENQVNPSWGAQAYDTTGPEILLADGWDMGSGSPAIDQAVLRQLLTQAANPDGYGFSAPWTFSAKRSTLPAGETSGVFQSPATVTIADNTAGDHRQYFYLWGKCTSTEPDSGGLDLDGAILPLA